MNRFEATIRNGFENLRDKPKIMLGMTAVGSVACVVGLATKNEEIFSSGMGVLGLAVPVGAGEVYLQREAENQPND